MYNTKMVKTPLEINRAENVNCFYKISLLNIFFNSICYGWGEGGFPGSSTLFVELLLIALIFFYKFILFFLTYSGTSFSGYKIFVYCYFRFCNRKTILKLGRNRSFLNFRLSVELSFFFLLKYQ